MRTQMKSYETCCEEEARRENRRHRNMKRFGLAVKMIETQMKRDTNTSATKELAVKNEDEATGRDSEDNGQDSTKLKAETRPRLQRRDARHEDRRQRTRKRHGRKRQRAEEQIRYTAQTARKRLAVKKEDKETGRASKAQIRDSKKQQGAAKSIASKRPAVKEDDEAPGRGSKDQ